MSKSYAQAKGRRANRPFKMLYDDMLKSKAFRYLTGNELKVLMYLISKYNGSNNGNLEILFSDVKSEIALTKPTLSTAIKGLIEKGFIVRSREGGKNTCSLYALTCYPVDECLSPSGLSVHYLKPTLTSSDDWKVFNKTLAKNK